ncbi:MAG: bifunctional UDP-N-acetylglucosamine diphosphorylase/glucosamine-1-phosphate N-acetyltransferase GlmU [Gammaproteobacteria bacterium]|nr:bifunctional UDP-N-acetylglucosamine diphosphorylase/glucosamine-1-phosphate N-acetyltransferase GlmU [Gammaproteobacteria bacterium]
MTLSVVILAAGYGKRMYSKLPKVLHQLAGQPLLLHVIKTAQTLNPDAIYVVYGNGGSRVRETLGDLPVNWVNQANPKGTGHAVLQALPHIPDDHQVLILYGDVPLIKTATLKQLLADNEQQFALLVATFDDPTGFGRIIRNPDNEIVAIIEHRDATPDQLLIQEVNTGILTGPAAAFKRWLPQLKDHNAQSEYYLTDIISLVAENDHKIAGLLAPSLEEVAGVNDRKELMRLERYYQSQKALELLEQGVTIIDPSRFDCRGTLNIANDVTLDINVILSGEVAIDEGSYIGPNTLLNNVKIGKNVIIKSNCVIEDAVIEDGCQIGPFARIRPHTQLGKEVHIGNFVELKNTKIDDFSKVNHLTYLGDSTLGKRVNVGAGTITCNYDGINKFETLIKDGAFIGSGTELVAPITIGENAYIGAGSTITRDAPDAQLTLSRAKQTTINGWSKKKGESLD